MATLDVISELVQGSVGVPAREVIQGEQFTLTGHLRETDDSTTDLDTANYTIEAVCQFYLASATATGTSLTVTSFVRSELPDRTLAVTKAGTAFSMTVPADIYTEEIAPAITSNVPIAVVFIRLSNSVTSTVDIGRFLLLFRRGLTA